MRFSAFCVSTFFFLSDSCCIFAWEKNSAYQFLSTFWSPNKVGFFFSGLDVVELCCVSGKKMAEINVSVNGKEKNIYSRIESTPFITHTILETERYYMNYIHLITNIIRINQFKNCHLLLNFSSFRIRN